jgi:uncharacterized damage-inducible protein DinB
VTVDKTLQRLARYNTWANRLMFDAVAALPAGEALKERKSVFRNMVHTLNHCRVVGEIWQAHLEKRPHGYTARNTADYPPLAELREQQARLDAWFEAECAKPPDEVIAFTLVGGNPGEMTRGEILLHVVNHNTYHRGYVAQMMYEGSGRPPTTDLPVYAREFPA